MSARARSDGARRSLRAGSPAVSPAAGHAPMVGRGAPSSAAQPRAPLSQAMRRARDPTRAAVMHAPMAGAQPRARRRPRCRARPNRHRPRRRRSRVPAAMSAEAAGRAGPGFASSPPELRAVMSGRAMCAWTGRPASRRTARTTQTAVPGTCARSRGSMARTPAAHRASRRGRVKAPIARAALPALAGTSGLASRTSPATPSARTAAQGRSRPAPLTRTARRPSAA